MQKRENHYWYKKKPSQARQSVFRFSLPVIAFLILVLYGFQPVFSESNNTSELDGSNTINTETESKTNFSVISESNKAEDLQYNSSEEQNSASIANNEVSIQIDDSTKASVSQLDSNISVSIKRSGESQPENQTENSSPTLVINGEEVDVPSNGRVSKVLRDDSSTTKLRTDIDSDGSSSIRIDSSSN